MTGNLSGRTATELVLAIGAGRVSSREVLADCLESVESSNPALNAVVTLDAERAYARAAAADAATAQGESWGPLHGLPMTIKDSIETAGIRTTAGASEYADHVPTRDADAVARLLDAGAVIFGKTNVPELTGDWQTFNGIFGTTNNPWDLARTPGGSSGGSAAATAAGLTPLELGSDVGGSIRHPAHCCGVYGHKPTYGIVPTRGHVPGPPGTLAPADVAVIGPLARSADDLELALDVLIQRPRTKRHGWDVSLAPPRHRSLDRYRLALWLDDPDYEIDTQVREPLEQLAAALVDSGAAIDEARPPVGVRDATFLRQRLVFPQFALRIGDEEFVDLVGRAGGDRAVGVGRDARWIRFATATHRDWLKANEERHRLQAGLADFFGAWDAILCPVAPVPAFPHDQRPLGDRTLRIDGEDRPYWQLEGWISLAAAASLPATVAPVALTADGLPVGVQIIGPHLEDRTTIDVARRIAEVTRGSGGNVFDAGSLLRRLVRTRGSTDAFVEHDNSRNTKRLER